MESDAIMLLDCSLLKCHVSYEIALQGQTLSTNGVNLIEVEGTNNISVPMDKLLALVYNLNGVLCSCERYFFCLFYAAVFGVPSFMLPLIFYFLNAVYVYM